MNTHRLLLKCLLWELCLLLAACQPADELTALPDTPGAENPEPSAHTLTFQVFTQAPRSQQPAAADSEAETELKSLYIYAFEDVQRPPRPDFYRDETIDAAASTVDPATGTRSYSVKMKINKPGWKRIYLLANPPAYVRERLTAICSEGQLKAMSVYLKTPLTDLGRMPQAPDGTSMPGASGLPMGNQLKAYVTHNEQQGLSLCPGPNSTEAIHTLPLYRALGKVSIYARKKAEGQDDNSLQLQLFNYTCDGYYLPVWQGGAQADFWLGSTWNPNLAFDLKVLSDYEKQVATEAAPLLSSAPTVSSTTATHLVSFYLCQNSYGKGISENQEEAGMEDLSGNRTTKLTIQLNDGRTSELSLPYLRRNDHLKITLVLTQHKIEAEILPWNIDIVTPEWQEGTGPTPSTPLSSFL